MFKGINDTPAHSNELVRLLNGLQCRVNLIRYHETQEGRLKPSDESAIQTFSDQLNKKGVVTTIRASRGQDIQAACGLLSTKRLLQPLCTNAYNKGMNKI